MWKVGGQYKGVKSKSLNLGHDIPIQRLAFLGVDSNTKRPSNSNCGSGSLSTMFEDDSSLSCTNFPATIWPTSFAGIDVNPEKPQRDDVESAPKWG